MKPLLSNFRGPLVALALLLSAAQAQAQTLPVVSCSTAANFLNSGVDANGAKLALGSAAAGQAALVW